MIFGHPVGNQGDNASFLNFNFYATSISTTDFSDHDYVSILLIVSYIYNRNCHLVLALLHPAAGDF